MSDSMEDNLIARTQSYLRNRENDKARYSAAELSRIDSKDAIVWYLQAKVHYMMDEYDDSLASLVKAAQIDSRRPEIWLLMGYTLIALRRYEDAKESLEYVHASQPQNAEASSALCVLFTILGERQTAKQYFNHSTELDKKATSKILNHFYNEVFKPSAQLTPQTKEALEQMLAKLSV